RTDRRAARARRRRPSTRKASERVSVRPWALPPSASPRERRELVVAHFLDVLHERLDRGEEGLELRARAEPLDVPFLRVPEDAQDEALACLRSLRQLVAEAVGRILHALRRRLVRAEEVFRPRRLDGVADVLNDHLAAPS